MELAKQPWAIPYEYSSPDGGIHQEGVDFQPTDGVVGWGPIADEIRDATLRVVRDWLLLRRERKFDSADSLRLAAIELGIELRAVRSPNGTNQGLAKLSSDVSVTKILELIQ